MPLLQNIKRQVIKKIEEYEGRVNHFYLDSIGKVTVGVGHLIVNRNAVSSISMYRVGNNGQPAQIATMQEKQNEYDVIARQQSGYRASWYKQHTKLVMKDSDIDRMADEHVTSFYRQLIHIYRKASGYPDDFDRFPQSVQLALFDMIFNLGPNRLIGLFPNLNRSVKAGDWKRAAQECNRPQVSNARNQYVRELFLSVARTKEAA